MAACQAVPTVTGLGPHASPRPAALVRLVPVAIAGGDDGDAACASGGSGVRWFVRCPDSCAADVATCDWAAAWTRTCGAARSYIPPVHYGDAPAPELAKCLHDHLILTIGDCNVRSLLATALDASDRGAPATSRHGAPTLIELGHHQLLLREAPYGHSRYRAAYRYHYEPDTWNMYVPGREPGFGGLATALLDAWRPVWDWHGYDDRGRSTVTLLVGGTNTTRAWVDDVADWLGGGCSASLTGCLWHAPRQSKQGDNGTLVFRRPRVILKSSPPYARMPLGWQAADASDTRAYALNAGFEWVDAFNATLPFAWFLGHDALHFDAYDVAKPAGWRAAGPVTLAITNLFLEALCGVLTDPAPSAASAEQCWQCT
jgi:hypothetical protein